MTNSCDIPTGAISAFVVNRCNLCSSFLSWYQFNSSVQAIIFFSKSGLKHEVPSNSQFEIYKTFSYEQLKRKRV